MNKHFFLKRINLVIILFVVIGLESCVSNKQIAYFQDIDRLKSSALDSTAVFTEPIIQTDDILTINIFTLDPTNAVVVNQGIAAPTLGGGVNTSLTSQATTGFLVDKNGEVELSVIGKVKLAGLTTYAAKELIREKAKQFYQNPNVQIRFSNYKVTVLGEVNAPAAYTLPNEKVTVLDAIGLAGDLTIYGKRENILIVRDNGGKKIFARLDLNSSDIFKSPYFYLRQNDVIYVEPNKAKVSTNNAGQIQSIGVITSIVSVLLVAISLISR